MADPRVPLAAGVVVAVAVLAAGCGAAEPQGRAEPCGLRPEAPPCAAGVEAGSAWRYALSSHCGPGPALFDGRWWIASGTAPPSWREPYDTGVMRFAAGDRLVYESDAGGTVELRPAPPDYVPPACA